MMTTEPSQPRKFMFDRTFDQAMPLPEEKKEPEKISLTPEQLEQTKKAAFQEGHTAGQAAAQTDLLSKSNKTLQDISRQLEKFFQQMAGVLAAQHNDSVELASAIARKIMPEFVEKHGLEEIQALIETSLTELAKEPRLVIRVSEQAFDSVNAMIETMTKASAFAGKIVLLADNGLGDSDVRIEWADGGMERDTAALWLEIDKVIAKAKQAAPQLQKTTGAIVPTSSTNVAV